MATRAKTSESDYIESVSVLPDQYHLARIRLRGGAIQQPTLASLHKYWRYANKIEHCTVTHATQYAVFTATVGSGQGGVIAIWNARYRRWEHISDGEGAEFATLLPERHCILSLHLIVHWGIKARFVLQGRRFDRSRDASEGRATVIPIRPVQRKRLSSGERTIVNIDSGDWGYAVAIDHSLQTLSVFFCGSAATYFHGPVATVPLDAIPGFQLSSRQRH